MLLFQRCPNRPTLIREKPMKNFFTFVGAVLLVACGSKAGQAQVGTSTYTFQNRAEVRAAVLQNLHNLRASYNVITCAGRQGMLRTVLQTYEQQLGKYQTDAGNIPVEMCSSYALAHTLYVWRETDWPIDTDRSIRVRGVRDLLTAQWYRDIALRNKPNVPEVLLGDALYQYCQANPSVALREMREVVRLAPNWADAHFWYARVLCNYAISPPIQKQKAVQIRCGFAQLRELRRAQALDTGVLPKAYMDYSWGYRDAGKPKEALACLDALARGEPRYVINYDAVFGRGAFAYLRRYVANQAQKASG